MNEYARQKIERDVELDANFVFETLEKYPGVEANLEEFSRDVVLVKAWLDNELPREYDRLTEAQQRAVDTALDALSYELGED